MKRSQPLLWFGALTLLASAGCEDQPPTGPDSMEAPLSAKQAAPPQEILTSDDEFARAARAEAPGLAGFYLEADGTPVILLKDHRQAEAAGRYLAAQLAGARRGRHAGAPQKPVFRKVTHDFAELKGWHDALKGAMPRDGVYMLDVDEVNNAVSVGVRDDAAIQGMRREAARLGVPPGKLRFRILPEPEVRITLRDRTDTLMGGFQIAGPPTATLTGECTYGFSAVYQNMWMMVTASHCTYEKFKQGSTIITQPTYFQGNEIGAEYADRGMWACAGTGTLCRKSDAAYVKLNGTRAIGRGRIAYTALGSGGPASSLEVIGDYDIIRRYAGSLPVGTWLDKTGRTTGSTYGSVTESCVTLYQGSFELRCQDVSTVYSDGGDSGAPMYYWLGNEQVELYGILWGGPSGDRFTTYSSRLAGIEQDLGALSSLCAPGYAC